MKRVTQPTDFYCVKAYKERKLNNVPNIEKTYIYVGLPIGKKLLQDLLHMKLLDVTKMQC